MGDEKLFININMPVEKGSLLSEIKALPKITAPPKKKKEVIEDTSEPLILSNVTGKKDKKEKKKKKKTSDLEFMSSGNVGSVDELDQEEIYGKIREGDTLIDIDELLNGGDDDDDDSLSTPIIDEQRRGYEKRKKDENPFKKEFAEELTLLYDLLDEMNKLSKELDKKYKALEGSKVRGVSKYTNDMVINMLSAKTNKLAIIKEINSLKKTIADLKIKVDAKSKEVGGQQSVDLLATQYFQKALNFGRNNFMKEMGVNSVSGVDPEEDYDDIVSQIERNKQGYNDNEMDSFQSMIEERLASEDNPFRSSAGSKYIEYENRGVKIFVKKCIDTGEWEFVALDRDNQQIYDYPVPKKRDVGKMKFSDGYAADERGRSYKVIEYFLPDSEEED